MKRVIILMVLAVTAAGIVSCSNYGKKKMFDSTELYYTDKVTEAEADLVGKYLQEQGFTEGDDTKTVQLTKEGDIYQFRMVVKEGYEKDEDYILIAETFAYNLSKDVFDGEEVEIHLCDTKLETLKVVKMPEMGDDDYQIMEFDGTEIEYDESVTIAEVKAVGDYLTETGFTDGTTKSIILIKEEDGFLFYMVSSQEYWESEEFLALVKEFALSMSSSALNDQYVEIALCDEYFNPQRYVSMN
ncbi:MAG: hypothetical protein PHH30_08095 [Bacteroidales bacterium]|nr:hypothetical protein [Bacteroidales bacterium]